MIFQQIKRCIHQLHSFKYLLLSAFPPFSCLPIFPTRVQIQACFLCSRRKRRSIHIRFKCIVCVCVRHANDLWKFKLDIIGFMEEKLNHFVFHFFVCGSLSPFQFYPYLFKFEKSIRKFRFSLSVVFFAHLSCNRYIINVVERIESTMRHTLNKHNNGMQACKILKEMKKLHHPIRSR